MCSHPHQAQEYINSQPFQLMMSFIFNFKENICNGIWKAQYYKLSHIWIYNEYSEAPHLGYTFRTGMNEIGHESHISRHLILTDWAICLGNLLPDLAWGGLAELPRGLPKPPNISQVRHILKMELLCAARQCLVPTLFFCSSGENSTVCVDNTNTCTKVTKVILQHRGLAYGKISQHYIFPGRT